MKTLHLVYALGVVVSMFIACESGDSGRDGTGPVSDGAAARADMAEVDPETDSDEDGAMDGSASDAGELLPTQPGDYTLSAVLGGREREFGLHLPKGFSPEADSPVYFVFHGGGERSNAEKLRSISRLGFNEKADADGGIVVYPLAGHAGEENTKWNDARETTSGADDVAFVRDLLGRLDAELGVDPEAVYAAGVSNGGMFAQRIACEASEEFTAIAPVIAALPEEQASNCSLEEPVSVLAIQGTADPFMTYCGGDAEHDGIGVGNGGAIRSAEESRIFWADANGCDVSPRIERLEPKTDNPDTTVYRFTHANCDTSASFEFYGIEGMGHNWPPTERRPNFSGPGTDQLNATDRIWAFFNSGSSDTGREVSVSNPNLGDCGN